MDIISFMLGKKKGGIDWSVIGYDKEPNTLIEKIEYSKNAKRTLEAKSNFDGVFDGDKSLVFAPLTNTGSGTKFSNMFRNCPALIYVPSYNTSNGTSFSSMFNGCTSLTTISQLDTSNATTFASMFSGCTSLTSIPELDASNVTSMDQMFMNCAYLLSIPELNAQNVTNIQSICYSCYRLIDLGGFKNLGKAYLTTRAANYTYYTLTLNSCGNLTHESLMNVINNLYDIATAGVQTQKLVLGSTNLAKLSTEEIAIATNKGWTVS